ncbi:MAG: aspartate aminotransferase family protein [Candidatus Methanomethylophilaceae archaeon]|nr:aspartate aminotransferase family protein [Candidatus Methanomethylophilaceae archaeon]
MQFEEVKSLGEKYLFQNYGRLDVAFEYGKGMYLYDAQGKEYMDLVAGIAVCSLGYSHPKWVNAMQEQVGKLIHVSNLYHVKEQAVAAEAVASITPGNLNKTLFVNSGAEANEAALKLAVRATGRKKILSALNSFHGRTAGSLAATGQTKYQDTFQPLMNLDSFRYYDYGDAESVKKLIDKDTAALIVEPIQGEGGVRTVDPEFFKAVRDLCTDNGALMIVDEVQTGIGRTGKWFGIENFGVVPDIISMAKALGAGVPIGAISTYDDLAKVMTPGSHGTTFGGNPLVTASVKATIDIMKEEKLVENSRDTGAYLKQQIQSIDSDEIVEVRGYGLMVGTEMKTKANDFRKYCLDNGVLVNVCHGNTVRIIPPLIMGKEHCDRVVSLMRAFLNA